MVGKAETAGTETVVRVWETPTKFRLTLAEPFEEKFRKTKSYSPVEGATIWACALETFCWT